LLRRVKVGSLDVLLRRFARKCIFMLSLKTVELNDVVGTQYIKTLSKLVSC